MPVANPLDAMCQAVYRLSGFPRERVIGMAGVLDSARMRTFIAMELNVSVENVHAFVLGGHGDTMVPLPRYSTVAGVPITELMSKERVEAICKRTADGGAEITKLVGTSAWYAPGAAAAEMVECILKDKKKILPCSVFLQGEYGIRDLFVGVPVKLGARGVEQIIEIKLTPEENAALQEVGGGGEGTGRRDQGVRQFRFRTRARGSAFRSIAPRSNAVVPRIPMNQHFPSPNRDVCESTAASTRLSAQLIPPTSRPRPPHRRTFSPTPTINATITPYNSAHDTTSHLRPIGTASALASSIATRDTIILTPVRSIPELTCSPAAP